ncbi:sterol homeostasis protein ARV1 [Aspergillus glaucus CBS 516.65]|uniref:Protein ARV n=1 Tax=Aspergillus glaucus CBS 516.65 TaxID=1160497 RepID=A0A1L9VEK1_ASPGL|nr:hypothetical protein ASPGLDRAFT_174796 [Aspergillus glaucus CBS 516.65]OJJ82340.1 hypothetical protein ASPGLDRAFT_174796 [Aspergillus glaucus CBS 516.65]
MPICIECSYPVSHLYSTYSRADDRSLGKGVRLTQCPRCQHFADKYVEYDFVVLFIDLVLIKPQVYRHLLFNRLGRDDNQFDRSIIRLGILLLLFDVYLTWARIEKSQSVTSSFLIHTPIIVQYFFFLTLNALATLAHHLTVRLLAFVLVPRRRPADSDTGKSSGGSANDGTLTNQPSTSHPSPSTCSSSGVQPKAPQAQSHTAAANPPATSPPKPSQHDPASLSSPSLVRTNSASGNLTPPLPPPLPVAPPLRRASTAPITNVQPLPPPAPASPTAISTALLVSSCAKLFPILLVIWGPDGSGGNNASSETYTQNPTDIIIARQQGIPTAIATLIPAPTSGLSPAISSFTSSLPGSWPMPPLPESWIAKLASMVPVSAPANQYLALFLESMGSLLSLGAADTHLVLLSNIEALYILLGCGYLRAVALAVAGLMARWAVQRVVLGVVGVG